MWVCDVRDTNSDLVRHASSGLREVAKGKHGGVYEGKDRHDINAGGGYGGIDVGEGREAKGAINTRR